MAASLVSEDWQQFVFQHFYGNFKSRRKVFQNIFLNQQECDENCSNLELRKTRSKIIDLTTDDNYNMLILTLVSGTPHVMCSSMFTKVLQFFSVTYFQLNWGLYLSLKKIVCQVSPKSEQIQRTFLTKIQNHTNKKSEKEILLLPIFLWLVKILGW